MHAIGQVLVSLLLLLLLLLLPSLLCVFCCFLTAPWIRAGFPGWSAGCTIWPTEILLHWPASTRLWSWSGTVVQTLMVRVGSFPSSQEQILAEIVVVARPFQSARADAHAPVSCSNIVYCHQTQEGVQTGKTIQQKCQQGVTRHQVRYYSLQPGLAWRRCKY